MSAPGRLQTPILLGLTAIQALCFVLIKAGLAYAPPLLFGGLRALLGGGVLLGLTSVLRQPVLPPRKTWGGVLALALSATTLGFGGMFLSPGRTGAGIASVLGNIQPLILVGLAAALLGERMSPRRWITVALGLAGVILISWQALTMPGGVALSGAALALIASAGAAIGSVIFKRMRVATGLLAVTAWQLILGSLPLLAVSALVERQVQVIWSVQFVGVLFFLALLGTSYLTAAWYWLVQRGELSRLALFLFLVPVFGLGIAALFGERVSLLEGAGLLLIVVGIVVAVQVGAESSDHARRAVTGSRLA
jgi:drug/metabolite transporter (DMT)-like permease